MGFITQYSIDMPLSLVKDFFSGKESCLCDSHSVLKLLTCLIFLPVASVRYTSKGSATSFLTYSNLLFSISKERTPLLKSVSCSSCLLFVSKRYKGCPPLLWALKYKYFSSALHTRFPLPRSSGTVIASFPGPLMGMIFNAGTVTNEVVLSW